MLGTIPSAMAQDQVRLFKIVSAKDDVVVGLASDELIKFGSGSDLDVFARHLGDFGQVTVWQYTVRARTRVAIFSKGAP